LFSATVLLRKNSTSQFLTTGPGKDGEASESGDGFPGSSPPPKTAITPKKLFAP
jgi:hypothetical protein